MLESGRDELVAIVSPEHPWAGRESVLAREFEGQPLVLYDRQSQITDLTLRFLFEEGVFPRLAAEIDHLEALKDVVRAGLGAAVIPRWAARREFAAGALVAVRLGPRGLRRVWGLLYSDGPQLSATLRGMVALFAAALPKRLAQTR